MGVGTANVVGPAGRDDAPGAIKSAEKTGARIDGKTWFGSKVRWTVL